MPNINDRDMMKSTLDTLVRVHGARAVAEELVEVLHDRASCYAHRHAPSNDPMMWRDWRRVACKLGNAVHWQNLVWPS